MKSFSKTGLLIGDKIVDMYGNTREVIDVGQNGFVYVCEYFYANDEYKTFEEAIKESWKILDDAPAISFNEEVDKGTLAITTEDYYKQEKAAIIKNNNELIEEIKKLFVPVNYGWASSLEAININDKINKSIQIIQSKNDLLSKE